MTRWKQRFQYVLWRCKGYIEGIALSILSKWYHVLPRNYEAPVPDEEFCNRGASGLVGVNISDNVVLHTLTEIVAPHMDEFDRQFPLESKTGFHPVNNSFAAADAYAYYGFLKHFKPKKIIEVGSGNSTLLCRATIKTNLRVVDLPEKVQSVSLSEFESLEKDDFLFIDSSHVLADGTDIWFLYCEVLPRLRPGVIVHVHDVALPAPYPKVYRDTKHYFNEQYVLQAFLTFNDRFEVLWPGTWLLAYHQTLMSRTFAKIEGWQKERTGKIINGSSFWLRRV